MSTLPLTPWELAFDVAAVPHGGAAALASRQARRLQALLATAQARSPFWQRRLAGVQPARARLDGLPVLHKGELMRDFESALTASGATQPALRQVLADPRAIGRPCFEGLFAWESSGSQGEAGVYLQDAAAMAVYDALELQRRPVLQPLRRWLDPWLLGERIAFVGATSGHFASVVSVERARRLNPMLAARLHAVDFLQPMARLARELGALAPTIVATYPGIAQVLADEHEAGRLPLRLSELWLGGETLSPAARRRLEQAFGCPVANAYGASEFLPLASQCRCGRLHANSDWVLLEPVDAQGRPVPAGETGASTLLTNLANHLQPLIRLDIGDRTRFAVEPCDCGSVLPVIEVDGRSDDSLVFAGAAGRVTLTALALSTVLEDEAGLFDFVLEQRGPAELALCAADSPQRHRGAAALVAFLRSHGAPGVRLRVEPPRPAAPGASGKRRRVLARPPASRG